MEVACMLGVGVHGGGAHLEVACMLGLGVSISSTVWRGGIQALGLGCSWRHCVVGGWHCG